MDSLTPIPSPSVGPDDIIVVDDEDDILELLTGIFEDEGWKCRRAKNSDECVALMQMAAPKLVILDIWMQGSKLDGLQLLEVIRKNASNTIVIMLSGHANIETAVTAIKIGAFDFVEKPFKADRLLLVVKRAIEYFKWRHDLYFSWAGSSELAVHEIDLSMLRFSDALEAMPYSRAIKLIDFLSRRTKSRRPGKKILCLGWRRKEKTSVGR